MDNPETQETLGTKDTGMRSCSYISDFKNLILRVSLLYIFNRFCHSV
jgi:hypothetical protein